MDEPIRDSERSDQRQSVPTLLSGPYHGKNVGFGKLAVLVQS